MPNFYGLVCYSWIALFLISGTSIASEPSFERQTKTTGTLSLALSNEFNPAILGYQDLDGGGSKNLKIEGRRYCLAPGIRISYLDSENDKLIGFLFAEAPISMFNGTRSAELEMAVWDRFIDGKVFEFDIGLRAGVSITAFNKLSFMGGVGFEKFYLAGHVDEIIRTVPQSYIGEGGFLVGNRTSAIFGLEYAVSRVVGLSVVLTLPQYDHDGSRIILVNDENGTATRSQVRLLTTEDSYVEIKGTINW